MAGGHLNAWSVVILSRRRRISPLWVTDRKARFFGRLRLPQNDSGRIKKRRGDLNSSRSRQTDNAQTALSQRSDYGDDGVCESLCHRSILWPTIVQMLLIDQ